MMCGARTKLRAGRQRLFELRLERGLEILRRDRPDQFERDAAVASDHERLRHPIAAPLDGGAAIGVGADRAERIAVAAEEAAGVFRLILLIDADDLEPLVLG